MVTKAKLAHLVEEHLHDKDCVHLMVLKLPGSGSTFLWECIMAQQKTHVTKELFEEMKSYPRSPKARPSLCSPYPCVNPWRLPPH